VEAFQHDSTHLSIRWVVQFETLDYKLLLEKSISSEEDSTKTSTSQLFILGEIVGAFLQVGGWEDCRVWLLNKKEFT
jgi:hypothetical protein